MDGTSIEFHVPQLFAVRIRVVYNLSQGGSNSVVECDLAKVEVAGSNPVSRSNLPDNSILRFKG
jgi:hypothetical protein